MLRNRFPEDAIVTAASPFDRRTWPKKPKGLSKKCVLSATAQIVHRNSLIPCFSVKRLMSAACAVAAILPLLVSTSGCVSAPANIRLQECKACHKVGNTARSPCLLSDICCSAAIYHNYRCNAYTYWTFYARRESLAAFLRFFWSLKFDCWRYGIKANTFVSQRLMAFALNTTNRVFCSFVYLDSTAFFAPRCVD